jgi:cbb3-type cytochrome oxidase maturation protein
MSVLFVLMGASLVMGLGFIAFFVWAVKSGQFDDTGTPPLRMLTDDEPGRPGSKVETKKQE